MSAPAWLARIHGFVEVPGSELGVGLVDPPIAPRDGDTNPTFAHYCATDDLVEDARWVLAGTPLHTVVSRDPWHLEASLLCPDCGLHGWIRNGTWGPA